MTDPAPLDAGAHTYSVSLPQFEGPLDLLLHLCQKHELDILDIPIGFITKKYLEYLAVMRLVNLDVAAEYLVMAATLAHIKSKMLLPTPPPGQEDEVQEEEEEDPREALIKRLLEYQKYKLASQELEAKGIAAQNVFLRGGTIEQEEPAGLPPLGQIPLFRLIEAFQGVLAKSKIKITHDIVADRISITDRIHELTAVLEKKPRCVFEELFEGLTSKFDLVITFLALLEMARLRMARLYQTDTGSPLYVEYTAAGEPLPEGLEAPSQRREEVPAPAAAAPPAGDAAPDTVANAEPRRDDDASALDLDANDPDASLDADAPDASFGADAPDTSLDADAPDASLDADDPDASLDADDPAALDPDVDAPATEVTPAPFVPYAAPPAPSAAGDKILNPSEHLAHTEGSFDSAPPAADEDGPGSTRPRLRSALRALRPSDAPPSEGRSEPIDHDAQAPAASLGGAPTAASDDEGERSEVSRSADGVAPSDVESLASEQDNPDGAIQALPEDPTDDHAVPSSVSSASDGPARVHVDDGVSGEDGKRDPLTIEAPETTARDAAAPVGDEPREDDGGPHSDEHYDTARDASRDATSIGDGSTRSVTPAADSHDAVDSGEASDEHLDHAASTRSTEGSAPIAADDAFARHDESPSDGALDPHTPSVEAPTGSAPALSLAEGSALVHEDEALERRDVPPDDAPVADVGAPSAASVDAPSADDDAPSDASVAVDDPTADVPPMDAPLDASSSVASITDASSSADAPVTDDASSADAPVTDDASSADAPVTDASSSADAPFADDASSPDAPVTDASSSADAPFADDASSPDAPVTDASSSADAPFADNASSSDASFADDASSSDAPFADDASASDAPLADDASASDAPFADDASSSDAPFADDASSSDAPFADDASSSDSPVIDASSSADAPFVDDTSSADAPLPHDDAPFADDASSSDAPVTDASSSSDTPIADDAASSPDGLGEGSASAAPHDASSADARSDAPDAPLGDAPPDGEDTDGAPGAAPHARSGADDGIGIASGETRSLDGLAEDADPSVGLGAADRDAEPSALDDDDAHDGPPSAADANRTRGEEAASAGPPFEPAREEIDATSGTYDDDDSRDTWVDPAPAGGSSPRYDVVSEVEAKLVEEIVREVDVSPAEDLSASDDDPSLDVPRITTGASVRPRELGPEHDRGVAGGEALAADEAVDPPEEVDHGRAPIVPTADEAPNDEPPSSRRDGATPHPDDKKTSF